MYLNFFFASPWETPCHGHRGMVWPIPHGLGPTKYERLSFSYKQLLNRHSAFHGTFRVIKFLPQAEELRNLIMNMRWNGIVAKLMSYHEWISNLNEVSFCYARKSLKLVLLSIDADTRPRGGIPWAWKCGSPPRSHDGPAWCSTDLPGSGGCQGKKAT